MEVRIGQGRQVNLDVNKSSEAVNIKAKEYSSPAEKGEIKEKDIKNALDKLNKFLEDNKTHAKYEVHDKLKDVMIKIIDDKTGDVIKEIPPKKILDMVAKMCEMVGVLFDKKA